MGTYALGILLGYLLVVEKKRAETSETSALHTWLVTIPGRFRAKFVPGKELVVPVRALWITCTVFMCCSVLGLYPVQLVSTPTFVFLFLYQFENLALRYLIGASKIANQGSWYFSN